MANWPGKWGFIGDLRDCVGKTIKEVELVKMEYGAVSRTGWIVRFIDGDRAFFTDAPSTRHATGPDEEAVCKCAIFTPEEYAEMVADRKRKKEQNERARRSERRQKYEKLKAEFGEGVDDSLL